MVSVFNLLLKQTKTTCLKNVVAIKLAEKKWKYIFHLTGRCSVTRSSYKKNTYNYCFLNNRFFILHSFVFNCRNKRYLESCKYLILFLYGKSNFICIQDLKKTHFQIHIFFIFLCGESKIKKYDFFFLLFLSDIFFSFLSNGIWDLLKRLNSKEHSCVNCTFFLFL